MSPGSQMLLSGALSFGVPLALAARELFVMRRRGPGWFRPRDPVPPTNPPPLSWRPSLPPLRPVPDVFGHHDGDQPYVVNTRQRRARELA